MADVIQYGLNAYVRTAERLLLFGSKETRRNMETSGIAALNVATSVEIPARWAAEIKIDHNNQRDPRIKITAVIKTRNILVVFSLALLVTIMHSSNQIIHGAIVFVAIAADGHDEIIPNPKKTPLCSKLPLTSDKT